MLLSAVTAAATFYVLTLTDFRGVQELGFIAGTAILLAWLAMMTVFPATLVLIDRRHADRPRGTMPRAHRAGVHPRAVRGAPDLLPQDGPGLRRPADGRVRRWRWAGCSSTTTCSTYRRVGTESVVWEKKILATSGRSGFAAHVERRHAGRAAHQAAAFRRLKTVSEVDSALLLIPDQQAEKRKVIADFAPIVAPVRARPPDSPGSRPAALARSKRCSGASTIAAGEAPAGDTQRELGPHGRGHRAADHQAPPDRSRTRPPPR